MWILQNRQALEQLLTRVLMLALKLSANANLRVRTS
jgi:hypothetical protein